MNSGPCRICGKTFINQFGTATTSCAVLHSPGSCCHYGQVEASEPSLVDTGFTGRESQCLNHLTEFMGEYAQLDVEHPSEPREVEQAIHAIQDQLAMRLARRLHPEIFTKY